MKRTRQWWAALTKDERSELWWLEDGERHSGRSSYYPDDCGECGNCGCPSLGGGLCSLCHACLSELLNKADNAVKESK